MCGGAVRGCKAECACCGPVARPGLQLARSSRVEMAAEVQCSATRRPRCCWRRRAAPAVHRGPSHPPLTAPAPFPSPAGAGAAGGDELPGGAPLHLRRQLQVTVCDAPGQRGVAGLLAVALSCTAPPPTTAPGGLGRAAGQCRRRRRPALPGWAVFCGCACSDLAILHRSSAADLCRCPPHPSATAPPPRALRRRYRAAEEMQQWRARDPVTRFQVGSVQPRGWCGVAPTALPSSWVDPASAPARCASPVPHPLAAPAALAGQPGVVERRGGRGGAAGGAPVRAGAPGPPGARRPSRWRQRRVLLRGVEQRPVLRPQPSLPAPAPTSPAWLQRGHCGAGGGGQGAQGAAAGHV